MEKPRPEPEQAAAPVRRDSLPGEGITRGTARMEAFADAVLAVAFTLPIVEMRLPDGDGPLTAQLLALWPSYLGYALASLITGIYWVNHHFSGGIYRTTGHLFNLATVLFLGAVGFLAFPARLFAEHVAEPEARGPAAVYLTLALMVASVTWWLKWHTGRTRGHVDSRLDPAYVRRLSRAYDVSVMLMIAAGGLAFVSWPVGLTLAALVSVFYLLPPPTPVYVTEAPTVEGEE